MPSNEARLKKLETKAVKVDSQIKKVQADLKGKPSKAQLVKAADDIQKIIKWIKKEVAWSEEVTKMLRLIDWVALQKAFNGGGGANPPQTPPSWPPPE